MSELELVRRETPVTASRKSRRGKYINDSYFTFWFCYVHLNAGLIETNQGELLVDIVMDSFSTYVRGIFENVAKQFIFRLNKAGIFASPELAGGGIRAEKLIWLPSTKMRRKSSLWKLNGRS